MKKNVDLKKLQKRLQEMKIEAGILPKKDK